LFSFSSILCIRRPPNFGPPLSVAMFSCMRLVCDLFFDTDPITFFPAFGQHPDGFIFTFSCVLSPGFPEYSRFLLCFFVVTRRRGVWTSIRFLPVSTFFFPMNTPPFRAQRQTTPPHLRPPWFLQWHLVRLFHSSWKSQSLFFGNLLFHCDCRYQRRFSEVLAVS